MVAAVEGEAQRGADGGVHAGGGPSAVHDREAEALLPLGRGVGKRAHDRAQGPQGRAEAPPAQRHRLGVLAGPHALGDLEGLVDALHQRLARDPVVLHPYELGLAARGRGEELLDRRVAEESAHVAVERARRPAPLDVAQDRDPHVLVQALLQDLADVLGA